MLITPAFAQQGKVVVAAGINYRTYPIDVEDIPPGPQGTTNGLPDADDDGKFWKTFSLYGSIGFKTTDNWLFSFSGYARHNLFHRLEGINVLEPIPKNIKKKKNFKYDFFIDIEKKIRLKKNQEKYLIGVVGAGISNINTRFDISIVDRYDTIFFAPKRYNGTYTKFTPRVSLGYQHKKIKYLINAYVIEDPGLIDLTSLWLGATLAYEFTLKKRKK
jgi:hypothetical protein